MGEDKGVFGNAKVNGEEEGAKDKMETHKKIVNEVIPIKPILKMKTIPFALFLIPFFIFLNGCASISSEKSASSAIGISSEVSLNKDYVIFPSDYQDFFLNNTKKRFTPNEEEAEEAMELFNHFLIQKEELLPLNQYKVQLFGENIDKRIILANYFCSEFGKDWKTEIVSVEDGGNCYFSVKVNLETGEIFDFFVNGEA